MSVKAVFGKILSVGEGVKVLFTNTAYNISVKANRMFLSVDLKADFGNTKVGKVYKGRVNREAISINGKVYDLNFYLVERTTTAKEVAKKETEEIVEM